MKENICKRLHEQRINVHVLKNTFELNNNGKMIQMKWTNELNRQISKGEIK